MIPTTAAVLWTAVLVAARGGLEQQQGGAMALLSTVRAQRPPQPVWCQPRSGTVTATTCSGSCGVGFVIVSLFFFTVATQAFSRALVRR